MSNDVACIAVTSDGQVSGGWGKTPAVAVASVKDGSIVDWRVETVRWNELHDVGAEGAHHARIVRFLLDNDVTVVVAGHMGEPMQTTIGKLGVRVVLGVEGDARTAAQVAAQS